MTPPTTITVKIPINCKTLKSVSKVGDYFEEFMDYMMLPVTISSLILFPFVLLYIPVFVPVVMVVGGSFGFGFLLQWVLGDCPYRFECNKED